MTTAIQYLKRNEIDPVKWDQCIAGADNGLIYAYSWYLDNMADNWDALVLNDYEAVMPLTWRRKYTIKYLYQPAFCQQSGVYGKKAAYQNQVPGFLSAAQKAFRFIEINLNFDNVHSAAIIKNNYILPLNRSYKDIAAGFKNNLRYSLLRAQRKKLSYSALPDYTRVIELYKTLYGKRFPHVTDSDYSRFQNLCRYLYERGNLVIRATGWGNNPLALSLLLDMDGRLYLIMSVTLPEGRRLHANHFHIHELIKEFSNRALVLDFEGSDIPGIAHFYKSFGCINQPYYSLRYNNLPFPLNLFKK